MQGLLDIFPLVTDTKAPLLFFEYNLSFPAILFVIVNGKRNTSTSSQKFLFDVWILKHDTLIFLQDRILLQKEYVESDLNIKPNNPSLTVFF